RLLVLLWRQGVALHGAFLGSRCLARRRSRERSGFLASGRRRHGLSCQQRAGEGSGDKEHAQAGPCRKKSKMAHSLLLRHSPVEDATTVSSLHTFCVISLLQPCLAQGGKNAL